MQRGDTLAYLVLASVVVLVLTLLMVVVDAQARIAFVSDRNGNFEIYVMDNDGGNQQNLSNNPSDDRDPSWSPDGKRIAFLSNRDSLRNDLQGTYEIYVMDNDGGNQQRLTENPNNDESPSWSPDGKHIAFSSDRDGRFNYEIYVMDNDGGNQQRLTNNADGNDDRHPSWSPDGKRIAFSASREGHFGNKFGITYEIYVMDANGRNQQRLTENLFDDGSSSWSPDGKRIAFSSDRKGDFQNYEIYVMNTDGENQQNLTNHPNHDISPTWFDPVFAVAPASKTLTMWGQLKQVDQ